jgi:hypothetical protein
VIVGAVIVAVAALSALATARPPGSLADPSSPEPSGAMAVAELLGEQGVHVERTDDLAVAVAAPAGSTLVVAGADRLTARAARALADTDADLVLIAPPDPVLAELAPLVAGSGKGPPGQVRTPWCDWPVARRAGPAAVGLNAYRLNHPLPGAQLCYPHQLSGQTAMTRPPPISSSLVVLPQRRPDGTTRTLMVLGDPTALTNAALAEHGNAALALGLLGQHTQLTWLVAPPLPPEAGTGQQSLVDLLSDPVRSGFAQLAVAVLLLAVWRARHLGRAVGEPLPVVVPAAETTQGRARLYRQTGAHTQAARALQQGAQRRLAAALGLPEAMAHDPAAVARAVAEVTGRAPEAVTRLLGGQPSPAVAGRRRATRRSRDAALVTLATELDRLEQEVHGERSGSESASLPRS